MRPPKVLIGLSILFLAIVLFILRAERHDSELFKDPHAAENRSAYDDIQQRPFQKKPHPTNLASLFTVAANTNSIEILCPATYDEEAYDFEPVQSETDRSVTLGLGTLRLAAIGIGYPSTITPSNFPGHVTVPVRWFNGDLTPMSQAKLDEVIPDRLERNTVFYGQFPSLRLIFATSNLDDIQFLGMTAFDQETHKEIFAGSGGESYGHEVRVSTSIEQWHQKPVELFLTVAIEPVEKIIKFSRENLSLPTGEIFLAAIAPGDYSRLRMHLKTSDICRTLIETKEDSLKPYSTLVFGCWPSANLSLQIECFDENGRRIREGRSGHARFVLSRSVEAVPTQIAEIRSKYYTGVKRIRFVLPEIPGLPEGNRGINNLFDVRVPAVYFAERGHSERFLETMLGLSCSMVFSRAKFPPETSPLVYLNTTPRQIMEDNAKFLPTGYRFEVNAGTLHLEVQKQLWIRLWERAKKAFGRWGRNARVVQPRSQSGPKLHSGNP